MPFKSTLKGGDAWGKKGSMVKGNKVGRMVGIANCCQCHELICTLEGHLGGLCNCLGSVIVRTGLIQWDTPQSRARCRT
jgi:hypothetical protein